MEDEPAPRPAIVSGPNLPGRAGLATTGTGVFNTLSGNTGSRITYQQGSFLGFDTGSSNIIYSNAIGDSYPNMGLMKLGLGTLSLYGANSYGGGTAIQNGTLAVSTTLPLPAGTVVTLGDAANDSGELVLGNGFNQWDQTLAGLYASGSGTGNRVAGTGIGTSTLTLDVTSGTDEFGGVLAGLALAVTGGGTVVLGGASTYAGSTSVSQGGLSVTGSITSAVTVSSGATLSGIGSTGAVTASGIVTPGVGGVGKLVDTGNLTLTSGAYYDADLTNAGCNQISVEGAINLAGATLNVSSNRAPQPGAVLVLVNNQGGGAVAAQFPGHPEGSTIVADGETYFVTYAYNAATGQFGSGNDVALVDAGTSGVPQAPTGLTVTPVSNARLNLNWTDPGYETGFTIERLTGGGAWSAIATVGQGVTSYSDTTNLTEGEAEYYQVLATIGPSQSAPSAMAYGITLPLAPTGLGVTYLNGGVATFTWTDASLLAAGCSIDQLMPGGTWRQIQTTGPGATGASAAGNFAPSTPYTFRVRAYVNDYSGNPVYSAPAYADNVTTPAWPAGPTGLTATAVSNTEIDLAWTDNDASGTYEIERSADGVTGWTQIGTAPAGGTAYQDKTVTAGEGTTCYYQVCATDGTWDSAYTYTSSATTLPAAPTSLTATIASGGEVDLTWVDNSVIATRYSIQQLMSGGAWQEIQTGGPQATSATLTGPFGPGVAYSFQVEAYTGTDDEPVVYSAPSQTATVQAGQWPAAPTGLTTSVISNSEIDLTWTDTGTGATNYEIDRTTDGQTWTTVTDTLLPNATSYNDTRLI